MKKQTKRICIVDTVYSLFLYYLICGINSEDIFIMSGGIPNSIRKNISHIYFPHFRHDSIKNQNLVLKLLKRVSIIIKRIYGIIKLRILLFFKTRNYNVLVYGQGHLNFSFPLYEYENSYIIEDGLANYLNLKKSEGKKGKLLNFFGFYLNDFKEGFGTHPNIKKVYLTKNEFPDIIKNKTEVINIETLWESKSINEKRKILEIYNIENIIPDLENNMTLLLTECFSEDGCLSFDEEIEIYRYLINKQKNRNIVIKTHPREKKDYNKIFPEFIVIDKPFPLELFKCLDLNINKIITVASTAALNFMDDCEIELYDKKTSSDEINACNVELKKKFLIKRYKEIMNSETNFIKYYG